MVSRMLYAPRLCHMLVVFVFLTALLVSSSGASDAGTRSGHVHPVRHRRVPGSNHLHEEFGRQPARQKEQEAAGFHLPNQK